MKSDKLNALEKLSLYWRNEKEYMTLDKSEIDYIFQYIRDLKDENTHLNDDIDNCDHKIEKLNEIIEELNNKIHILEFKYESALSRMAK